MNHSKIYCIFKEYVHSPFFYSFLFLFVTEFFIWFTPIYDIREAIWSKQIWYAILFPSIVITFLSKIPIKALSRSRKQVENRSPLSHRILMGGTLGGMLMVEILFFWVGLYIILGIQHPQVIINKNQFSISHIEGIIMECIIPMANYFLFIPTRNAIKKQISLGQYYDKVEEFEFAFPLIWMTLILSLIGVAVYNISDP